jgi:hypothetical protein
MDGLGTTCYRYSKPIDNIVNSISVGKSMAYGIYHPYAHPKRKELDTGNYGKNIIELPSWKYFAI